MSRRAPVVYSPLRKRFVGKEVTALRVDRRGGFSSFPLRQGLEGLLEAR
ncbi:hypothetical protein KJ059_08255 [Myxococcota bacterium]|nr:hypothetical protein [Myxococcota bacterium]MCZ7619916.1 hypothetical protein [Myxococcota bacterium]